MESRLELVDEAFLIATGNEGKRREFEHLLEGWLDESWSVVDRKGYPEPLEPVEETGQTYVENGLKKAMESAKATGCCALADDSGLEVEALDGAPGVHSARFAGEGASDEDNNQYLIESLQGVEEERRGARFVAVICLALPDNRVSRTLLARQGLMLDDIEVGAPRHPGEWVQIDGLAVIWFRGVLEGRILEAPMGDGGFGYDPYFWVPELDKSLAQLSPSEKNRLSHRARAVAAMKRTL